MPDEAFSLSQLHRITKQTRRNRAVVSRQPSADVLKRMAVALHVTADFLLFDEHERGPDTDLTLQFEAVNQFSKEEKHVVRELLEGLILKYEARRWNNRTPEQGR
ncbi:hypothetical protein KBK24_0117040 [Burkholderia sp. K24]|nr:hypothetical protein KBK24_0117040 [Burkholderia sp. K24]